MEDLKKLSHKAVETVLSDDADIDVFTQQLFRECQDIAEEIAVDLYVELVPLMNAGMPDDLLKNIYSQAFYMKMMANPKVQETYKLLQEGR